MDFDQLYFKKQGTNYKVFIKKDSGLKPIGLKASKLNMPFGLEVYNHKEIINLDIPLKKGDNSVHNFHVNVSEIERFFNRCTYDDKITEQYKIQKNFHQDMKLKEFVPCLKKRSTFEPILRAHLKKQGSVIKTRFQKNGQRVSLDDLKDASGEFIIILDSVWIKNGKCGLLWIISKANLIS